MKKRIFIILTALIMASALVSCKERKTKVTVVLDFGYDNISRELDLDKGDKLPEEYLRPERGEYQFVCWLVDGRPYNVSSVVEEDVRLVASWSRNDVKEFHTVTYHDYDGSVLETVKVEHGKPADEPKNKPFKSVYYEFQRWDKELKEVQTSEDVYPVFCYRETDPALFDYRKTEGGYYISAAPKVTTNVLCLPRSYKGEPVVGIDRADSYEGGIFSKSAVTNVYVPATYRYIGDFAFYMTENLTEVYFEENSALEKIGVMSFMSSSLTSLKLPSTKKGIDTILETGSFMYNTLLNRIELSPDVTDIGMNAFFAAGFDYTGDKFSYPVTLIVPENNRLKTVGDYAFKYSYIYGAKLNFPELSEVGNEAFYGSYINSLKFSQIVRIGSRAFYPRQTNNYFVSDLKELELGSSIRTVGDEAFFHAALGFVSLPDSLESLGNGAFKESGLTELTLPASLTTLGESVFAKCGKLSSVVYATSAALPSAAFEGCSALSSVYFSGSVSRIGDEAFAGCALETPVFPTSLESVGAYAFKGCPNLTEVLVPNGVKEIGAFAFADCPKLQKVSLSDNAGLLPDFCFRNCQALVSVNLPVNLTAIGDSAFARCAGLTSLQLPDSIVSIGANAFVGTGLINVMLPTALERIGANAFEECLNLVSVTIPRGTLSIEFGSGLFNSSVNMQSIVVESGNGYYSNRDDDGHLYNADGSELILFVQGKNTYYRTPETLKKIGDKAFMGNIVLQSLVIEAKVEEIGTMAFAGSDGDITTFMSLENVDFSRAVSLKSIGDKAFFNCKLLTKLDLGRCASLEDIGDKAFYNCRSLESVNLPDSLIRVGASAFEMCESGSIPSVTRLNLASTQVEYIGGRAFKNWSGLSEVALPDALKEIHEYAFENCASLEFVDLSKTVLNAVDNGVFKNSGLTEVRLPVSVTNIMFEAFSGVRLRTLDFEKLTALRTIGNYAFYGNRLGNLTLSASVEEIGPYAFAGNAVGIKKADLGNSRLTSLAHHVFFKSGLEDIVWPSTLTSIGDFAFVGGTFKSLKLVSPITKIGVRAFDSCLSLTDVSIGDDDGSELRNLGAYAFGNCPLLERVFVYAAKPPAIPSEPLFTSGVGVGETKLSSVHIYVPDLNYVAYNLSWADIADQIYMMSLYASQGKDAL